MLTEVTQGGVVGGLGRGVGNTVGGVTDGLGKGVGHIGQGLGDVVGKCIMISVAPSSYARDFVLTIFF